MLTSVKREITRRRVWAFRVFFFNTCSRITENQKIQKQQTLAKTNQTSLWINANKKCRTRSQITQREMHYDNTEKYSNLQIVVGFE